MLDHLCTPPRALAAIMEQYGRPALFTAPFLLCLTHTTRYARASPPVRTALVALIGFLPTPGEGALGALDYPAEERRALAQKSVHFCCPKCGPIANILPSVSSSSSGGTLLLSRARK
jgi:hypothetical protein